MSLTMHSASVAIFAKTLGNLLTWLDKAEAHAAAKKYDTAVLMGARLAPDMLPFSRQIQIACDTAKFCAARLTGREAPAFEDTESSFDELRDRVRRTIAWVESVPVSAFEGSDVREVTVPRRAGPITMSGENYLKHFALPNFFFHATTTYALLRHNGVDLGKADFLGALN